MSRPSSSEVTRPEASAAVWNLSGDLFRGFRPRSLSGSTSSVTTIARVPGISRERSEPRRIG